jgi:hypothetical protein
MIVLSILNCYQWFKYTFPMISNIEKFKQDPKNEAGYLENFNIYFYSSILQKKEIVVFLWHLITISLGLTVYLNLIK